MDHSINFRLIGELMGRARISFGTDSSEQKGQILIKGPIFFVV